jgi:CheY-like chemotaxis protein
MVVEINNTSSGVELNKPTCADNNNRAGSPANDDEEEDQNNRTGDRELNSGGSSSDGGSSGSEGSSSQHGSVDCLPNMINGASESDMDPSTSTTTISAPATAASITMSIKDEGDGWLSTASAPQLPNASSINLTNSEFSEESNTEGQLRWVSFEVHDSGVGIAPKSLAALFHDYVQGDADEMEKPRTRSGTGLGLAICGKQVAVLGGVIGALTKPSVGSVFWFKVPMLIPPEQSEDEEEHNGCYVEEEREEMDYPGATVNDNNNNNSSSSSNNAEVTFENNKQFAAAAINFTAAAGASNTIDNTNNNNGSSISRRMSSGGLHRIGSDLFLDGRGLEHSWKSNNDTTTTPGATPRPSLSSQQGYVSNSNSRRQSYSHIQHDTNNSTAAVAAAASGSGPLVSSLEGVRVLVVEDNMINRKVACRVLQSLGIECEVASNGQEAVDAVAEMMEGARGASETSTSNNNNGGCGNKKIDVVLMDMCMPVMNGVEATKAIRNLGCLIPIVAMTANAEDKDKEQCLAAGMNGFLSKPVLREQLAGCIMEAKCSSDVDGGGGGSDGGSDVNNNNNNNTC